MLFSNNLTSVSTISYAESNGGIFILIAPLGITNTNVLAVLRVIAVICQQYGRIVNNKITYVSSTIKGHKSLECSCVVLNTFDIRKYNFLR